MQQLQPLVATLEHPEFQTLHLDLRWHTEAMTSLLYAAWKGRIPHLTPASFRDFRAQFWIESLNSGTRCQPLGNSSLIFTHQSGLEGVARGALTSENRHEPVLLYLGVGSTGFCRKFIHAIMEESDLVTRFHRALSHTKPLEVLWTLLGDSELPTLTIRPFSEVRMEAYRAASAA